MTNFSDPSNIASLVGLWDFRSGATNQDTGLADGVAQNGHFEGNAFASGDQLRTDGHSDWFDTSGADHPFDLPRGTIEVQFTQEAHKGHDPDTVVNRGEFCDARHEGYFGISVTLDGKVELLHQMADSDGGACVSLSTAEHFFSPGDTLNVVYSWDEHTGATFTVENLTKGTSTTIQSNVTGLTMDVGDNDDENFTFGAREFDDGHYDEFFKGAIDYVAVYNKVIAPEGPTGPDFIVEGTSGADVIDAGYTGDPEGDRIDAGDNATGGDEDVVDAGAGDDTVLAGAADDTVFAGSGDDSVEGSGGNDVIFGDQSLGQADANSGSVRESLNWSQAPDPNGGGLQNGDAISGFTQNTGNVDVTFSVLNPNAQVLNQFENTAQNTATIDSGAEAVDGTSSFYSETRGHGNTESYQLAFSTAVENVSFRINDIDGDGVVRVQAFDAAGNPIQIDLTGGSRLTLLNTDGVAGADTADSNGGYLEDTAPEYSLLVEIPGPVARIVITHTQNGLDNSGVNVTDVFFDVPVAVAGPEGPGDDTLSGGAGDDLIYGETGDDSILGGSGNDSLYGDDAPVGTPVGPNLIVNGSFEDTTGMTATGYGFVANNGVIPGWTDTSGNAIDVHNDDRDGQVATDGENWLDLEASPGNNRIGQDVAGVQDGVSYRLTFDVSDSQFLTAVDGPEENTVNVFWGGQLVATIDPSNVGESDFQTITLDLIGGAGDGSNRLEFQGLGREDNLGAAIDNVSLVQLSDVTGPAGNDTIEGGDGDDLIVGQGGNDDLSGGTGNDTILGGAGDDIVGGSGDDSIVIDPTALDATGDNDAAISVDGSTEGTDRDTLDLTGFVAFRNLVETPDADGDSTSGSLEVLNGDGEWVPVSFTEIETLLLPPKAPDGIVDGEESGEVMGLGYNDANAPTDGGGDQITNGNDVIEANGGNDTVDGAGGNDTIDGGTGDDVITGGAGDDSVTGGQGADVIAGGSGNDTLAGGAGDDDIAVGGGDVASGGTGDDVFTLDATDPAGNVNAVIDGGSDGTDGNPDGTENGNEGDVLDLSGSAADLTVNFTPDPEDGTVNGLDGDAATDLTFAEIEKVITGTGDDTVDAGDATGGVDVETGAGNDDVTGGAGDDTIDTGTGDDVVDAGAGDDVVEAGAGDDVVEGGAGDDTIDGGEGSDTLAGGEGADEIDGGAGDDDIVVGAGDVANGGSGDDEFTVDPTLDGTDPITVIGGETGEDLTDPTNGGDGDILDLRGLDLQSLVFDPTDPTFDPVTGVGESGTAVYLNDAGDPVTINFSQIENVLFDPLPDGVVDGEEFGEVMGPGYDDGNAPTDGGGDIIDGPDGLDDSIRGNGGNDTINAGAGNDTVDGGADDDVVNGGTGDDVVMGGAGDDLVTGGFGNDTVLGGEGNDELRGNDGNDSIDGGNGNDSMGGAEGDDTVLGGAGNDTLSGGSGDDVMDGGADADTINGNSGNDNITDFDGDNVINAGVEGTPDRGFPFVGGPDANPFDDRDTVTTGFGNDQITTGDDDDVIFTLGGNNTIDAGFDDDQVTTGDGDDLITAGEGSDTINAGGGNDTIFAGENEPLVNLIDDNVNPANNDPILDNGDDLIDAGDGDDVVFGEDDNDTILGGAGNDTLDGGIDDDVIEGGAGDDLIVGGQGADSLAGGEGSDTFTVGNFTDPIFGDTYREGAGDTIVGGEDPDGNDVDVLDLTGNVDFDVFLEDSIDPTGTSGESGRVVFYTDATKTVVQGELVFREIEDIVGPICFTPGTLIATPRGEVPVESLREGDKVITRDNGIQEIRWVGNRTLDRAELAQNPHFKPILVKKGSLGHGLPERDMVVSPQHRLLVANETTELYFNETEVLVPAKHLVNKWGITQLETLRTTYIHFMFDRHEVVLSNGSWTESFQPGQSSMSTLGDDVRQEILALFPELKTHEGMDNYVAARRSLKAHEAKLLQL